MKSVVVVVMLFITLGVAFAQTQPPPETQPRLVGRVVPKPDEKRTLVELAFTDQVAVDKGLNTHPVSISVRKDGSFVFPASSPVGVTIVTTPPCFDMAAILVRPLRNSAASRPGDPVPTSTEEVNLLEKLMSPNSTKSESGYPLLGAGNNATMTQMSFLWGAFTDKSMSITSLGKDSASIDADLKVGLDGFGLGSSFKGLFGGVNLGCSNEQRAMGGKK